MEGRVGGRARGRGNQRLREQGVQDRPPRNNDQREGQQGVRNNNNNNDFPPLPQGPQPQQQRNQTRQTNQPRLPQRTQQPVEQLFFRPQQGGPGQRLPEAAQQGGVWRQPSAAIFHQGGPRQSQGVPGQQRGPRQPQVAAAQQGGPRQPQVAPAQQWGSRQSQGEPRQSQGAPAQPWGSGQSQRAAGQQGEPRHQSQAAASQSSGARPKYPLQQESRPEVGGIGDVEQGVSELGLETTRRIRLQIGVKGRRGALQAGVNGGDGSRQRDTIRRGTANRNVSLLTNLFKIEVKQRNPFHHYQVLIEPEVHSAPHSRRIIRRIEQQTGIACKYVTDGASIYSASLLDESLLRDISVPTKKEEYKVTLKYVGPVAANCPVVMQILNVLLNNIVEDVFQLKWMSGNYFDPSRKWSLGNTGYDIFPGFFTSILECENGIRLMMDVTHKLVSTETAWDVLSRGIEMGNQLIGRIVLTKYNDKTYKVTDIITDKNPVTMTFRYRGSDISLAHYYKMRYDLNISDLEQPLLGITPRKREIRAGFEGQVRYLIPEFCSLTGFSDEIRANHGLMKDFSIQTKLTPNQRMTKMSNFAKSLATNEDVKRAFDDFGISLSPQMISTNARTVRMESSPIECLKYFDASLIVPVPLDKWAFIYPKRLGKNASDFLQQLQRSCTSLRLPYKTPLICEYNRSDEVVRLAINCVGVNMILTVLERQDKRVYSTIKKALCITRPIGSQVMISRNLNGKSAIVNKVAVQMSCKLGGAGWTLLHMKTDGTMIVGIDTYHDTDKKSLSYVGVVATMNKECTKYFTTWISQSARMEISSSLRPAFKECLNAYKRQNGQYCSRIVVYRDGVGDGQLNHLRTCEINDIQNAIKDLGANTKLTVVVVKKRNNARFFQKFGNQCSYTNPPSGTVIDSEATRPDWQDFYLINQVAAQGSVSPTHFNVILDESMIPVDELQLLTYQQCHLYYNWNGAIRVPATCHYAHKVAFLIGQSLHGLPSEQLKSTLFYL